MKKLSLYSSFHLQLLQNTGYVPCVIQYILEPHTQQFVLPSPLPLCCPSLCRQFLWPGDGSGGLCVYGVMMVA